jgi:hypothetical protein
MRFHKSWEIFTLVCVFPENLLTRVPIAIALHPDGKASKLSAEPRDFLCFRGAGKSGRIREYGGVSLWQASLQT